MDANRIVALSVCALIALGGCATPAKDVPAIQIASSTYGNHDCDQLAAEGERIQRRATHLGSNLDQAARDAPEYVAAGLLLSWRAFAAVGGSKQQVAEYARLKGEYEAVERVAIAKNCAQFASAPTNRSASTLGTLPAGGTSSALPAAAPVGSTAPVAGSR